MSQCIHLGTPRPLRAPWPLPVLPPGSISPGAKLVKALVTNNLPDSTLNNPSKFLSCTLKRPISSNSLKALKIKSFAGS
jgi:hypothetical protein